MKKCIIEDRHKKLGEDVERCFYCNKKIGKSFDEKLNDEYKQITQKMKDEFMKALGDYNNIGESMKIAKLPDTEHIILLTGKIIKENTHTFKYIKVGNKIIT